MTSCFAFIGNVLVIIVEIFGKRSALNLRKFLINLAISDILLGVFSVPFTYTDFMLGRWIFPYWLCPFTQFILLLTVFVTSYTLTVIGIERINNKTILITGRLGSLSKEYENHSNISNDESIQIQNKTNIITKVEPIFQHLTPKLLNNSENIRLTRDIASVSAHVISHNISIILKNLLDKYDNYQRPGIKDFPTIITTNLLIRSIGPISELDMEYSLDCYFRQKWLDTRLQFIGPSEFLSLNINMLEKIWKPDTYFHTGKGSHLHTITRPNKFLRIYQNGSVLYSMRLTVKSLCPMDLHDFPMDKQSCPLIFGSYGYPDDQLVYSWESNGEPVSIVSTDVFSLSQFDLLTTPYRNGTVIFQRGNYSMLQVNFNLRRHVGYFLIQIYVPCTLIVILSWVSFWINREATSDRVGLGVTAVLTLSTFGLDSRVDLPRVRYSYATALDWFTIMCFLFVVFTLLEFAGVHYFTKVGTGEVGMIEIDEDWAHQKRDRDNEDRDPLHIIAPPKAYQSGEKKLGSISSALHYNRSHLPFCPKHKCFPRTHYNEYISTTNDKYSMPIDNYLSTQIATIRYSEPINEMDCALDDDDNYEDLDDDNDSQYETQFNDSFAQNGERYSQEVPNCCLQFWYCLTVSERYKEQMKRRRIRGQGAVNSVSLIDKTSRILFPFVFILLNIFYWGFYIMERNSEFKMWQKDINNLN